MLHGYGASLAEGALMTLVLALASLVVAQFEAVRESVAWPRLSSAWFCAVAALAINTCAYTTEIIAGAIRALPAGEIEAAYAMGLSRAQMLRRVALPSALRRALPAYGNEIVMMLHGTSLASIVALAGLLRAAEQRLLQPMLAR